MSNYFSFLLEASLILLLLFSFYLFVLNQKASPAFNRFYLLFSLLFAVIAPLISIPVGPAFSGEGATLLHPASQAWNYLPELVITGGKSGKATPDLISFIDISWSGIIVLIYFAGVVLSLVLTSRKLLKLYRLIRQSGFHEEKNGYYRIANTNGKYPTFSFLSFIFWDNMAPLTPQEAQQILMHEYAHVKQRHSLDLLMLEFVTAMLWFNPLIYLYRRALILVHEHLADRFAAKGSGKEAYLSLIVKQTFRQANLPLASSFFQHNTLNRIQMLQKKTSHTFFRAALGASVIGIIFFVAACHDDPGQAIIEPQKEITAEQAIMSISTRELENGDKIKNYKEINEDEILVKSGRYLHRISGFKNPEIYNQTAEYVRNLSLEDIKGEGIALLAGNDNIFNEPISRSLTEIKDYTLHISTFYDSEKSPLPEVKTVIDENKITIETGPYTHRISNFKDKEVYRKTAEYASGLAAQKIDGDKILKELIEQENGKVSSSIWYAVNSAPPPPSTSTDHLENTDQIFNHVFEVVEEQPTPIGGIENFYTTIGKMLRYPEAAKAKGTEGRVFIQFIVEKDGSLTDVHVVKGLGEGLDEAAEEVIKASSGQWKPGYQKGKPVRTRMVIPILFKLD